MFPPASSGAQGGTHRRTEGRQLKQQNHPTCSRKLYLTLRIDALIRITQRRYPFHCSLPAATPHLRRGQGPPSSLPPYAARPRSAGKTPAGRGACQAGGGLHRAQRRLWQEAVHCCAFSSCCYSCLYPPRPPGHVAARRKGVSASEPLTARGGSRRELISQSCASALLQKKKLVEGIIPKALAYFQKTDL